MIEQSSSSDSHPSTTSTICAEPVRAIGVQPTLLLLLASTLVLGILGQYNLQQKFAATREFPWEGLLIYVLAVVLFTAANVLADRRFDLVIQRDQPPPSDQTTVLPGRKPWRIMAVVLSLILTAVALFLLGQDPPLPDYNWVVWLWLAAMLFYLAAVALPRGTILPASQPAWWHDRGVVWTLVAILVVAFVLRIWRVGEIPPTLSGDEGSQGLEAIRVIEGDIRNPFTTGWLGVPTMSFYFNALSILPLGNTMFALRLPWVLVGTATVFIMFLLITRLGGVTLGLMTAAFLAMYDYHIHYSRLGSNQVADALFVALALLFFYRGFDRHSPLDWALSGVIIGIGQYFYAGARFTAIVIMALIIFFTLRDRVRFWRAHGAGVLILAGAALIVSAPMIQYAFRFPDDYNARINMVGIIQSGWLEREQSVRHQGPLPILFDQFQRAALAFHYYPDRTFWYGSPRPLFGAGAAVLFTLGFGYSVLQLHNRRLFPLVAWWGGAMIMGGMLTESPPSSQRLITMAAPAVFFVVYAVLNIGHIFLQGAARPRWAPLMKPYLAVVVVTLGVFSIHWYFVQYTPLRVYGNPNAVVATSLGKFASEELGPDWQIFFFGPPRMYIGFGSIPYLAPDVPGQDIHEPITEPPDWNLAELDRHVLFVFLPERLNELELVKQAFPGGELREVPPPPPPFAAQHQPLYTMYILSREQLAQ